MKHENVKTKWRIQSRQKGEKMYEKVEERTIGMKNRKWVH